MAGKAPKKETLLIVTFYPRGWTASGGCDNSDIYAGKIANRRGLFGLLE